MQQVRLHRSLFYIDVRLREFNGRWLASADTPDGPSLGWGMSAVGALWMALWRGVARLPAIDLGGAVGRECSSEGRLFEPSRPDHHSSVTNAAGWYRPIRAKVLALAGFG